MLGLPEPLFWGGAEIRKFGPLPKGWGGGELPKCRPFSRKLHI